MKDRLPLWLGAVCLLWMSQVQAERINFQCDDSKEDTAKLNAAIHASHSGDQLQIHYVYIGVPSINYGTGQINVTGNNIRGAGSAADVGLDFELDGGRGLNLLSSGNHVESVIPNESSARAFISTQRSRATVSLGTTEASHHGNDRR